MTIHDVIEQLESCGYECEAGRLEDNAAFRHLKRMAATAEAHTKELNSRDGNPTYLYDDPAFGWAIAGYVSGLSRTVVALAAEMEDGEEMTIRIKRQDMTQAEMDAAPEV